MKNEALIRNQHILMWELLQLNGIGVKERFLYLYSVTILQRLENILRIVAHVKFIYLDGCHSCANN